jgi:signal transduction histidine kinase
VTGVRRAVVRVAIEASAATLALVLVALAVLALAGDGLVPASARLPLAGGALAGGLVGMVVAGALGARLAARLGGLLDTLRRRAERLAGGDPRPAPLVTGLAELDRLDETLVRGAQSSARRLASERDFAADASHQLRTPLTALLMRLEEIAGTDDLEVVAEESTIAIAQVERLSGVVDDLMSRTRSGVAVSPAVSLDSVLAALQREWQHAFANARRSIHVSGERGLEVRATPVALAQILTTLLENSLAHGRGTVEIAARRAGPSVVIEVTDGGEGVPAAIAPHVFERSVSSSGSGLGLSLARDLAEAAGGRLELVSARPAVFALFLSAGDRT